MTRTALRLLAATVAACLALLLGAAPASAHTRLESSNPTDKSSVDAAPESVSLTFNEDISAEFATMSVVGPDGTNYQSGQVSAAGGQVSTAVSPLGPAGVYQIGYRVVSDDGHPVQGKVSFT
ncbi:MAG TPA: copper resistance CopC family protein, partial [Pseudonocardia sp.]|nr:copper resistance CopC family protein [Pseudonocardia sp.]